VVERRRSTLIFVPDAHGKVVKLQFSRRTLLACAAGAITLAVLSIVSLITSTSYLRQRAVTASLERENVQLRRTNQRLAETVAQVQSRLDQFEQRTRALAIAAGVTDLLKPSGEFPVAGVGSGGPLDRLSSGSEALIDRQRDLDRQLAKVEQKVSDQVLLLAHTPTIAPVVGVITDGFGPRLDPFTRRPAFHEGLDISVAVGTPVSAPADGVVVFAGREGGYGKVLRINHGYGFTTLYAHLDRFLVNEGDRVTRGQQIAKVGMTGRTNGSHLHYEVWKDGTKQNPLHYILDAY